MSESRTVVILGAGLAGAKAAEALRTEGFDGRVVLVGAEAHRPYERPPLSKGYLTGSAERGSVFVHPEEWYAKHDVELRTGVAATAIDRAARTVTLEGGEQLGYDALVLATGAEPRRLPVPGAELDGVRYLRTLDDSDALRGALAADTRVVIVGAGWIGLETAAAARKAGAQVTVLEAAELPLLRVLGPEIAQVFADLHRSHDVDLRLGAQVASIAPADSGADRVGAVVLGDGTRVPADLVVVGIGAAPRVELAEAAGLTVDNGVVVDQHLRSSDPAVLAVGDVANAFNPTLGTQVRVEHWANALNQPATAAATVVGREASHDRLPYFYTDQFELGMEYTGHVGADGYDSVVVRGDLDKLEFIAFWTKGGRVLAGMNVNVWDVTDDIKALIGSGRVIDAAALADPSVPLGSLLQQ